jgi:hypothetical protein
VGIDILDDGLFQPCRGFCWVWAKGFVISLLVAHQEYVDVPVWVASCGGILAHCVGFRWDEFEGPPGNGGEESAVGGALLHPFEVGCVTTFFPGG